MLQLILAQALDPDSTVAAIREAFHRPPAWNDKFFGTIWVVFAIIAVGWIIKVVWPKKKAPGDCAIDAFNEAAKHLGLSRQEMIDITKIAARSNTPHLMAVLLSPNNFAVALRRSHKKENDPHIRKRALVFGEKFFEQKMADPTARGLDGAAGEQGR